ncbi:MAG: hypothetical protein NC324_04470 [Bacteroides sp.]|nr:hypothetical protein [Bacteroides sp.]MCM1085945.1 hypothetical protein [Bacteroides sp.]MCM1169171.1 hypothetical protein [Bacteroides sp.]
MARFSERYGYTKVSDVLIREQITVDIQNAICNCYDELSSRMDRVSSKMYTSLERLIWIRFMNKRKVAFDPNCSLATTFFESEEIWYKKLDLVEFTVCALSLYDEEHNTDYSEQFVENLNEEFERLHFAYRVVDNKVVDITSEVEIKSIEKSIDESPDNIKVHLEKSLELYAKRPDGDYRNSIKESISAVEAYCREQTGERSLGKAFNKLEKNGFDIPKELEEAFKKLYCYTNDEDTGIRHSLMDATGIYTPGSEEALFMLVACSAFINYLRQKQK